MTRVVVDATPLIYLAKLGDLHLLDESFDSVVVPSVVREEVVDRGRREGYADAMAVDDALGNFLAVRSLSSSASERATDVRETANLGEGETAAIALAAETHARCLTDDHAARTTAESLGVPVGGTIFVLLQALDAGLVDLDDYVERLDRLEGYGFRMSGRLYRRAVDAGEKRVD